MQQKQVAKEQAALLQKELNALLLRYNAVEHKRKIFDQQLKDEEEVLRKIKSSKRDQLTLAPYFDKHFSLQSSYVAWLKKQVAQNSASLHAANARDFMRDKNVALSSKEMDKSEKALDQLITDVAIAKQEKLVHPLFDWVSGQWNHHGQNYLVAFRNDFEIPQAYLDEVTKEMDGMFIIGKTLPTQAEHKLALAAALFGQQHPFYQKWDKNHKNAKHAIELLDRGETWSNDGVRLPRDYEAQLKTMNKLIPKDNERLQRIQSYAAELTKQLSILEKGLHSSAMNLAEKLLLHEQSKATTNKLSYDHQRQINEQLTTSLAEHISKHFNSVEAVKKESNALMNLGNINVYPMGQLNDSKVKAIINQGQFFACQKLIQETDNKSTSRLLLLAAQSCQQALKYSNNGFDEYMVKNHPHFTWQHTQTFSSRCTGGIGQLTHLEYSHDNKFMLIGRGKSGLIMQLWANPSVFHRHESPSSNNVHKLAPNGRFLASSGSSKSGRKWTYRPYLAEYNDDFTERVPAKLLGSSHVSPITGLDISQNSKYLLVTYMREPAELWDLEKRRRLCTIGKGESENGGFNTGIFAGSDNFIVLTKRKGLMVYQLPEEEKNYYKGPTLKLTKPMNIPYQAFYKLFPITNEPKVYMSQGMCLDLNTGALDIVPVIDESHGIIAVSSDKKLMALKVYDAKLGAGIGIYDRIKQSYLGCIPVNSHDAVAFSKDGSKIAVYSAKHQVWIFEQMSSN